MPILPRSLPPEARRRWKRWSLACYRLGIILVALACLRALPKNDRPIDRTKILTEAKAVFPSTVSLGDPKEGTVPLLDQGGKVVGWATTSFPQAERVQGYSGPSELLIIFDPSRVVKAVRFVASGDTPGHVTKIRDDANFWEQWTGKTEAMLGAPGKARIVTGATLTSEAMTRGIAARFGAGGMDQWFPAPLTLENLKPWFPTADRINGLEEPGAYEISKGSEKLGTVLRSSRMGVSARGFNGISDVIISLDASGETILGIGFLGSRDNPPYIDNVAQEVQFADGFAGKSITEVMAGKPRDSGNLIVSGASRTAGAVIESVHEMLRRHQAEVVGHGFPWKTYLACVWIALGILVGLSKWGNKARHRIAFAIISVAAGITLGWMVSQDQLLGWGTDGLDFKRAMPLLILTAVAMVVPAFTGKNIYCSRICPHGAAQSLAGQVIRKRFHLPPKIHWIMERVPWLTLIVIWILAFFASGIPFAYFEPFETWSSGFVAFVPAAIFTAGIIAAFFLPQAYCHYGCPTGALLKFLTHAPGRWTMKDSIAGSLVLIAAIFVHFR